MEEGLGEGGRLEMTHINILQDFCPGIATDANQIQHLQVKFLQIWVHIYSYCFRRGLIWICIDSYYWTLVSILWNAHCLSNCNKFVTKLLFIQFMLHTSSSSSCHHKLPLLLYYLIACIYGIHVIFVQLTSVVILVDS